MGPQARPFIRLLVPRVDDRLATLGEFLRNPAVLVRVTLARTVGVASDTCRRTCALEDIVKLVFPHRATGFERRCHRLGLSPVRRCVYHDI